MGDPAADCVVRDPRPATTREGYRSCVNRRALWIGLGGVAVAVVVALLAAAVLLLPRLREHRDPAASAPGPAAGVAPRIPPDQPQRPVPTGPDVTASCAYPPAPPGPLESSVPPPPADATVPEQARVRLRTSAGPLVLELSGRAAPCTVNAFITLVGGGYYRDSRCHRLTTQTIHILQCGDPSGSGQGGPGWQFADENLPTAPAYPRGTVAMANSGPGTNGSQFFLVYRDSRIDPDYTVFGTVVEGLDLLDRVAAAGTEGADGDGRPRLPVVIQAAEPG
jgi:peptidyl-prolyl cis-trans isomerase B (cyclophilin B)